jgi:hypothetical protein
VRYDREVRLEAFLRLAPEPHPANP